MRHSRLFLLLAPVLLAGCSAIPGWPIAAAPAGTPTGTPAGGPGWVVVSQGSVTPSATPAGRPRPTPSATTGFLPRRSPGPTPTPRRTCSDPTVKVGVITGLAVTERAGTAMVRWFNVGGGNVASYRLTAIPQALVSGKQPDLVWQTITPTTPCTYMSVSVSGLKRNAPYVFSLDAVLDRVSGDGTHSATFARSGVLYTS